MAVETSQLIFERDDLIDCSDGSDEAGCAERDCAGSLYCGEERMRRAYLVSVYVMWKKTVATKRLRRASRRDRALSTR